MHGNKGRKQTKEHTAKINTIERARKISKTLKLKYKLGLKVCWTKGKKLSNTHKQNIKNSCKRNSDNHCWKGDNAGYRAKHDWIRKYFGDASKCENRENNILPFKCSVVSSKFQWAKKKGCRYTREKKDYYQLCVSCHSKYDYNPKNRICSVKGCGKKHHTYGYCEKHSRRFKKWGNPLAVKMHHNPINYIL